MKSNKNGKPLIIHLDGIDVEQLRHGQLIIIDKLKCDDIGYVVDYQYTTIGGFTYKYFQN